MWFVLFRNSSSISILLPFVFWCVMIKIIHLYNVHVLRMESNQIKMHHKLVKKIIMLSMQINRFANESDWFFALPWFTVITFKYITNSTRYYLYISCQRLHLAGKFSRSRCLRNCQCFGSKTKLLTVENLKTEKLETFIKQWQY